MLEWYHPPPVKAVLTDNTIDAYEKLLHWLARMRSCPVDSGLVDAYVREHDIGGVWNIDAEYVD